MPGWIPPGTPHGLAAEDLAGIQLGVQVVVRDRAFRVHQIMRRALMHKFSQLGHERRRRRPGAEQVTRDVDGDQGERDHYRNGHGDAPAPLPLETTSLYYDVACGYCSEPRPEVNVLVQGRECLNASLVRRREPARDRH